MKKNYSFLFFGTFILFQINIAQTPIQKEPDDLKSYPVISGLHTLSIHVRDTITHDSVFHFLVDTLKLPVYYYPVKFGNRKYGGIYTGNLVLEPCGPYSNFTYASNDFRAIFFGLTFVPFNSIPISEMELENRKIHHQAGDTYIYLHKDTVLCGDNMTISFMDRIRKISDKKIMDSLRYAMNAGVEVIYKVYAERKNDELLDSYTSVNYYNAPGIEYVKEICIGYNSNLNLQKWKDFIRPGELIGNVWECDDLLRLHFIESRIKEVQSITFKVKSLEQTKRYLSDNNLIWSYHNNRIELDRKQAFGLTIYFTERY